MIIQNIFIKIIFISYLLVKIIQCQIGFSSLTPSYATIFSPKQLYQGKLEINPIYKQIPVGTVLVYNETISQRIVYVGLDDGGIQLFSFNNASTTQSLVFNKKFSSFSNGKTLLSNKNQTILWFVKNYAIEIIDISSPFQPKLLQVHQINSNEKENYFLNIQFDFFESRVFVLRQNGFDIYQIQNDFSLLFVSSVFEGGVPVRSLKLMQNQTYTVSSASFQGFSVYYTPSFNSTIYTLNNQQYPTETPVIKLLCRVVPNQSTNIIQLHIERTYVFVLDEFKGFWVYDISKVFKNNACGANPTTTEFVSNTVYKSWNQQTISFQPFQSSDLILVVRSDIIMIFHNYPRSTIGRIQEIDTKLLTGKTFAFNSNNSSFALIGESYANIYIKVDPVPNRSYPNLLNIYQSSVNTKDMQSISQVGWQCIPQSTSFFSIRQYAGLFAFQTTNLTYFDQKSQVYPNPNNQNDQGTSLKYFTKNKVMIVGVKGSGLFFWNYTKQNLPVFIGSNSLVNNQQDPGVIESARNDTILLVANGIVGLSFVNITDITNTSHIFTSKFEVEDYSFSGVAVTSDGNYVYASARFYGYMAINITNITNPIVMKRIISRGGEKVTLSQDQQFLLVADATYGVSVVNITNRGTMEIVSTTKLDNHVNRVKIFNNDYILIAQRQDTLIALMDITNRAKPKVISKIQYPGLSECYDVCVSTDKINMYAMTQNGILTIQTLTTQSIHAELAEIIYDPITNQVSNYRRMEPIENLYIGMTVEVSMVHYNPLSNLQFFNAFLFSNGQFSSLPPWITFYPKTKSFKIEVIANSLDTSQTEHKGYLNIETSQQLFKSTLQLANLIFDEVLPNSFIDEKLQITLPMSIKIHSQCIEQGIITMEGYNSREYNLQTKIPFTSPDLNNSQIEFVRQTIKNKQIIYPVPVTIASSLLYNNDPSQSLFKAQNYTTYNAIYFQKKKQGYIITNQDFVYLTLYLQDQNAKFVPRKYSGALVSFSEEKDYIKIQGDRDAVNEILQKQIQVYVNDTFLNQIELQVKIEDQVNNPITIIDNLVRFTFISYNNPVTINNNYTLQEDFSKRFDKSVISIKTDFVYQINRMCFIDLDDNETIIFYIKIVKSGDILEDLKISSWLQYSSDDRKLYGTPETQHYGDVLTIRIIASDGFTEAYQDITINVTGIPFTYLFSLIFTILSPILGFLSVWKFKYIMINVITRARYISPTPDIVKVGEVYQKQIPLVYNQVKDAEEIWKFISQSINVNQIKNDINIYLQQSKQNSQNNKENLKSSQIFCQSNQNKLMESQNIEINDQIKQDQLQTSDHQLSKSINVSKAMNESQNLKIRKKANTTLKQLFVSHLKSQKTKFENNTIANELFSNLDSFIQIDGGLNKQYVIQMCKNLIHSNKENQFIKNFQREIQLKLDNQNSYLSLFLVFKISEIVMKNHNETFQLYKFIKSIGVPECGELEWYKSYTKIIPQFNNIFESSFPSIQVDNFKIQNSISLLQHQQQMASQRSFSRRKSSIKVNFDEIQYLIGTIHDQVISSAYGFSFINNSINARVLGESIFDYKHNIATITALEKRQKRNVLNFQSQLIPISLYNNSKLPSWITSADIINNTILIQGKPEYKDIGRIHIQIVDKRNLIAKQFEIEVIANDQLPQQQQQQQQKENYQQQSSKQFYPIILEKTANGESFLTSSNILINQKKNINSPLGQSMQFNDSPYLFCPKKFELFKQSEIEIVKTDNQTQGQMLKGEDEITEAEDSLNLQKYIFSTNVNSPTNVNTPIQ